MSRNLTVAFTSFLAVTLVIAIAPAFAPSTGPDVAAPLPWALHRAAPVIAHDSHEIRALRDQTRLAAR